MGNRLQKIRRQLELRGYEALLITHGPNVYYLSNFTGSSAFLVITLKEAFFYTDFRYLQQARKEVSSFEIVKVEKGGGFNIALDKIISLGLKQLCLEEAHLSLKEYNRLQALSAGRLQFVSLFNLVEESRAIKDRWELEHIARAAFIAGEALQNTLPFLRPGITELDLACELEYRLRRGGSERLPFDTIVASGWRSALPHGVASSKVIEEGDLVTIDFGAVYSRYCSDMTRTFIMGEPDQRQQEIHNLVHETLELAINSLRVGDEGRSVDAVARSYLEQHGYGESFGHGLGHGVGLEVHELPTLSPRGQETLQEFMVFTVEPGIYLEGWGGVRLEDMVLLAEDGPKILSSGSRDMLISP